MREELFQRGGHVADVQVAGGGDEQYSTTTSGIYSVEGSEGSNSPEYNRFRSRVTAQDVSNNKHKRWSVGLAEDSHHVARMVVGEVQKGSENISDIPLHTNSIPPPTKPGRIVKKHQGRWKDLIHE